MRNLLHEFWLEVLCDFNLREDWVLPAAIVAVSFVVAQAGFVLFRLAGWGRDMLAPFVAGGVFGVLTVMACVVIAFLWLMRLVRKRLDPHRNGREK